MTRQSSPIVPERGKTETYACKCCSRPFVARVADRNRGWARFCSKSCKATRQAGLTPRRAYVAETDFGPQSRIDSECHPFCGDAFNE